MNVQRQNRIPSGWSSRMLNITVLIILVLGFTGPAAASPSDTAAATPDLPQGVPPHPRLLNRIQNGAVRLPRHMTDRAWAASAGIEGNGEGPQRVQAPQAPTLSGTVKMLAVAVDFSDKVHTVTASYFDSLLFAAPVAGPGSMRDYYNEISYGQIDFVTVNLPSALGWKRAPQTYSSYVNGQYGEGAYPRNGQKLAEDVIDAINSVVDFSQYDNNHDGIAEPIVIIHAGPGAEVTGNVNDIWSYSWSTYTARYYDGVWINKFTVQPEYMDTVSAATSDGTMGVYAHEVAHGFFGVPDTYDIDYSSRGVGDFDLMSGGSWNGPNNNGSIPAWPSAWIRKQMGFVTPTVISTNVIGRSIPQAYGNPVPAETVLKLSSPLLGSKEYFLLENRQTSAGTYDQYLPGGGLFIWHIDEAMTSNASECYLVPQSGCSDTAHSLVELVQADGHYHLEKNTQYNYGDAGDPFPGTTNKRSWTNATVPETSSYYAAGDTGIRVTNISNSGATMTADITLNPPPAAAGDGYSTSEDTPLTITAPGVLSNDTNIIGGLSVVKVSDPAHGTLALNADGSFSYVPTADWNGQDSFTYKANDGASDSNIATVTLTVNPVNDAPLALNDGYTTVHDTPLTISAPGVLGNDTDVEHDSLTVALVTGPTNGALTLNNNGSFSYTPTASWSGKDNFTYRANDGLLNSNVATVTLTVTGVNTAPVAADDSYGTDRNAPLLIATPGILGNDTDGNEDPLTAEKAGDPLHGVLLLAGDGSFTYTPNADWSGTDTFTYRANDGALDSNLAIVTINVRSMCYLPFVVNHSGATP